MSSRPRTPVEFPRMKDRAAGRRIRREHAALTPATFADFTATVAAVSQVFTAFGDGMRAFSEAFTRAMHRNDTQNQYALAAASGEDHI